MRLLQTSIAPARAVTMIGLILLGMCALPRRLAARTTLATVGQEAYIEQKIGAILPPELVFFDEGGQGVHLRDYLGTKPILLILGYYTCPNLCPVTLAHLTQGLNGIGMNAGSDFQIVAISIDQHDAATAALDRKKQCLRAYKRRDAADPAAGWHFLTGDQKAIDPLKDAVGFHCAFDASHNSFAHAAGVMVVSPNGRLSHYFFGTDYSPADLESALKDAAAGRATTMDQPDQQYCFDYDPRDAKYGRIINRALQATGTLWALLVVGYIAHKLMQDARARRISVVPTLAGIDDQGKRLDGVRP